jgi:serine protease
MRTVRIHRALLRSTPLLLSLLVAACGGSNGSVGTPSVVDASSDATKAEVAAAASAVAATTNVAPQIAAKVMAANALKDNSMTDRFIVKYKTDSTEGKDASAVDTKLTRLSAALPAKAHHLRRMGIGADVVTADRKLSASDAKAFMRGIASDPNVEYVEPDAVTTAQMVPNDPLYADQWHLHSNQAPTTTPNDPGIRAPGAWDVSTGAGQVVAVLDTGVTAHSDLNANLLTGYDFVNPAGGNGFNPGITTESCSTASWHGTHVAGVVAALINNNVGVAGVAPNAKILPIRVLNSCGTGFMSYASDGIVWAAGGQVAGAPVNPTPAKVISLSLASWIPCDQSVQSAIDYATSKGSVVVVAAGNWGAEVSTVSPASCRNVVTVGGSDRAGSNYGWSDTGRGIDIAAPANSIWSTWNNGAKQPGGDDYAQMDGTSAAAPQVSGVLALVNSVAPKALSVAELRALLQQSVQPFLKTPDAPMGPGIMDAAKTVATAKAGVIPVAADFTCSSPSDFMQINCTDLSTARGSVPIKQWAWNFGDVPNAADMVRTMSVQPTINEQYPGTFNVRLTVTDANGATSTVSRPVNVSPPNNIWGSTVNQPAAINVNGGGYAYFQITLPSGLKSVSATASWKPTINGAWLYLDKGPSSTNPDCSIRTAGQSTVTCTTNNPPAGTYYAIVSTKDTGGQLVFTYQ